MHSGESVLLARRAILLELGHEELARLHAPNRLLDALGILVPWITFGSLAWVLSRFPFGVLWVGAFVAQGLTLQIIGFAHHDIFLHRRVGGATVAWLGSLIHSLPLFTVASVYEFAHLTHHRHVGTEKDTEEYKQDLDARWKRWLYLTLAGQLLAPSRVFATLRRGARRPIDHRRLVTRGASARLLRRLSVERWAIRAFMVALAAGAFVAPRLVLFGYVLPVLVVTPVASTFRVILEHAETNPNNAFHIATFYKTGIITRLLFFWDSGDCHLVHHLYSTIPYYRMGRAVERMRPILLREGVVERYSFIQLLQGFFVKAYRHRSLWP